MSRRYLPLRPALKVHPAFCIAVLLLFGAHVAPVSAQTRAGGGLTAQFDDSTGSHRRGRRSSPLSNRVSRRSSTAPAATLRRDRSGARPLPDWLSKKIVSISVAEGVDPLLVLEMMRQESGFAQRAKSPKGAQGLMQFIPTTARRFGVDPNDPDQAIRGACRYIKFLADRFGNQIPLILAGYNAGEAAVSRAGNRVPRIAETQQYVASIMAGYRRAKELQASVTGRPAEESAFISDAGPHHGWEQRPAAQVDIGHLNRIPSIGAGNTTLQIAHRVVIRTEHQ